MARWRSTWAFHALRAREIPFLTSEDPRGDAVVRRLDLDGAIVEVSLVSMGNPHAVQLVADVDAAPVTREGPRIERDFRFPEARECGLHGGDGSR